MSVQSQRKMRKSKQTKVQRFFPQNEFPIDLTLANPDNADSDKKAPVGGLRGRKCERERGERGRKSERWRGRKHERREKESKRES